MLLSKIISAFEKRLPLSLQEKWDRCGLNLGHASAQISSVLFSYDVCVEVLEYAITKKCQLIVSHHPFCMSATVPLKLDNYEGRLIELCIKNDIALYSSHTNHDASVDSLNFYYLNKLGLQFIKPLIAAPTRLFKLAVYIPQNDATKVMNALFDAGAGQIGNYGECSYRVSGTGTFKGDKNTNPAIGKSGVRQVVSEERVETIVKEQDLSRVITAMKAAHPYEEVAYDIYPLENKIESLGLGAYGIAAKAFSKNAIVDKLKKIFGIKSFRFVDGGQRQFTRIGIVTGSGASLLNKAISHKLDLFITGDVKYHQAIEAKRYGVSIADVGHFYSEKDSVVILKNIFEELFKYELSYHNYTGLEDPFSST